MLVVGLTGGIGSGKSTLADLLAARGARVIDADEVAREVVAPGEPALDAIVDEFGDGMLDDDGTLDREAMAARVFDDDGARDALEAITHPRIAAEIGRRLETIPPRDGDGEPTIAIVDHPLLVETGQAERFPVVVVVTAPPRVRLRRLTGQRGMDPGDARARMRSQASDVDRRAAATHVVDNSGDLAALERRADELWRELRQCADGQ